MSNYFKDMLLALAILTVLSVIVYIGVTEHEVRNGVIIGEVRHVQQTD